MEKLVDDERTRLQDKVIELLNEQLRECRERLDGQTEHLADAYRRAQLESDLRAVCEGDLRDLREAERGHTEALSARDERIATLTAHLERARQELAGLQRTLSWRLTRPLRLFPRLAGKRPGEGDP